MIALNKKLVDEAIVERINVILNIERGEEIDINYNYGLRQLMEIAIKALSPGINDPGTAVISLQAITDLLAYRLINFPHHNMKDEEGNIRVIIQEDNFEKAFVHYVMPIWDYGKNDRFIQAEMLHTLNQLKMIQEEPVVDRLLNKVRLASRKEEL